MDIGFEQLLAQHNQEFKEAEVFDNWMPPDAEYMVSLVKLTTGTTKKDGTDIMWWNLRGRIEDVADEKLHGSEFTVGYYSSKVFGILKGAAKTLAGRDIDDLAEANAVLEASIGGVLRVEVRTSRSKKDGRDYINCYIKEVIDTTTETTSAEDVSNAVQPAPIEDTRSDVVEVPQELAVEPAAQVEEVPLPEAVVDGSDNPPLEAPLEDAPLV